MKKLGTTYLGLTLRSPLIVSSSRLTATPEGVIEAEKNGAGAVVLKSLFEEQIHYEINSHAGGSGYPEADDYMAYYIEKNSVGEYLKLIRESKKHSRIPVIASINCYSSKGWTEFAREIAAAGADALEINVFFLPHDRKEGPAEAEKLYLDLVEKIVPAIGIPVSIKLGFRFSNILHIVDQFYMRGVRGVVMFNRFYEPDIDTRTMQIVPAPVFSTPSDMRYVLRWIAMASAQDIRIDISASTGVHDGDDAIKYILAGAHTVQVCSVLYEKGVSYLSEMNDKISGWMDAKGFRSIGEFRGKLNWRNYQKPSVFERTQFMKYFSASD